jgi:hypothetical protein
MGKLYVEGHFTLVNRKSYEATEAGPRDAARDRQYLVAF